MTETLERLPEGGYVFPDMWKVGPDGEHLPVTALCYHFDRDGSSDCMNVATVRAKRLDWDHDANYEYACDEHADWLVSQIQKTEG